MQLIDLSLSHLNFYCPATGQLICNENDGANYEADSLMGYWSSYSLQEPFIKNECPSVSIQAQKLFIPRSIDK